VAEKQQDANRRVAEAAKRADQLAEENANLHLELEARPSMREFRENQRLLTRLTRKIEVRGPGVRAGLPRLGPGDCTAGWRTFWGCIKQHVRPIR
jgi:hypothetical protein